MGKVYADNVSKIFGNQVSKIYNVDIRGTKPISIDSLIVTIRPDNILFIMEDKINAELYCTIHEGKPSVVCAVQA